tara:strand:- start:1218 stop:2096 length:879 start_codon:yes stop_codon:yes gene_type:complete
MSNIIIKKTHESAHNQVYDIKEKGKSNFVDDKSLVNNIVKEYEKTGKNWPVVFGVPRSGSTLVRNILNTIFDGRIKVQHHAFKQPHRQNDMVVASYRDFRDCAISKWRMNFGGFDKDKDKVLSDWLGKNIQFPNHIKNNRDKVSIQQSSLAIRNRSVALNDYDNLYQNKKTGFINNSWEGNYKVNENIYFARYEDFHNNFDLLMNHFEEFFNIVIKKDLREFIHETWNKDRIKKVYSDSIEAFGGYDKDTEIHGQHIYKGKVGTWREILIEKDHHLMTSHFKDQLERWGYEL